MFKRNSPDWKRRIPTYKARTRERIIFALGLVLFLYLMAVLLFMPDQLGSHLVALTGVFASTILAHRLVPGLTQSIKYTLDDISPLEEVPGRDVPVAVTYMLGKHTLGGDCGYLGLRKEGISFSGVDTTFLVDPLPDSVYADVSYLDNPFAGVVLPILKEKYHIRVEFYERAESGSAMDRAIKIREFLLSDRSESPTSTVHNLPPLTASQSIFNVALVRLCKYFASAALIPGLTILFVVWWAGKAGEWYGLAIVLLLFVVGYMVVLFRELLPSALSYYQVILKLDKEALTRNTNLQ